VLVGVLVCSSLVAGDQDDDAGWNWGGVAGYEHLLDVTSVSPLESLVSEASYDLVPFGSYGHPLHISSDFDQPRWLRIGLDGIPLSDAQVEVFDCSWLPQAGIEAIGGATSRAEGSHPMLNLKSTRGHTVPRSRVGVWWGAFSTRMLDLSFSRMVTSRASIACAYENLSSSGWLRGATSDHETYFGRFEIDLPKAKALLWVLANRGKTGIIDTCIAQEAATLMTDIDRTEIAGSVGSGADSTWHVSYWHIAASEKSGGGPTNRIVDGVEVGLMRRMSRFESYLRLGLASKDYKNLDELKSDEVWGRLGISGLGAIGFKGAVGVCDNSVSGTGISGLVSVEKGIGEHTRLCLRASRDFLYPTLEGILRGRETGGDVATETKRNLEITFCHRIGGLKFEVRGFLATYKDVTFWDSDSLGSLIPKTCDTDVLGFESRLEMSLNQRLKVSISYLGGRVDTPEALRTRLRPDHTIGWYARFEEPLSNHVTVGAATAGRWASKVDDSLGDGCLSEGKIGSYADVGLIVYVEIDKSRAFVRIRNLLDDEIVSFPTRSVLPGRLYEWGLVWHLLD